MTDKVDKAIEAAAAPAPAEATQLVIQLDPARRPARIVMIVMPADITEREVLGAVGSYIQQYVSGAIRPSAPADRLILPS